MLWYPFLEPLNDRPRETIIYPRWPETRGKRVYDNCSITSIDRIYFYIINRPCLTGNPTIIDMTSVTWIDDSEFPEFGAAPAPRILGLDNTLEHDVIRLQPRNSSVPTRFPVWCKYRGHRTFEPAMQITISTTIIFCRVLRCVHNNYKTTSGERRSEKYTVDNCWDRDTGSCAPPAGPSSPLYPIRIMRFSDRRRRPQGKCAVYALPHHIHTVQGFQ